MRYDSKSLVVRLTVSGMIAWAALLFHGCGGGGPGSDASPSLQVTPDSSTVSLARGDHTTVELFIERVGESDPVSLRIEGLPEGVTATFNPTIVAGESAELQLESTTEALDGQSSLLVIAETESLMATATIALTITSLTVNGRIAAALGTPWPNVKVAIQGNVTTTDEEGRFTIEGVTVPYDVVTHYEGGDPPVAHVFLGLRRSDPQLLPFIIAADGESLGSTATLEGSFGYNLPIWHRAFVCIEGIGQPVYGCGLAINGASSVSIDSVTWAHGESVSVRVHALLVQIEVGDTESQLPIAFPMYGITEATLTNGGDHFVDLDLQEQTIPTSTLSVSTTRHEDLFGDQLFVVANLTDTFSIPFVSAEVPGQSLSDLPVPVLPGASYGVYARSNGDPNDPTARSQAWATGIPGGGDATLELVYLTDVASPPAGTEDFRVGDLFALESDPGGVTTFFMRSANGPTFVITTMGHTATMPDLSIVDFELPSNAVYWLAAWVAPGVTSMDEGGRDWFQQRYMMDRAVEGGPTPAFDGTHFTTRARSLRIE